MQFNNLHCVSLTNSQLAFLYNPSDFLYWMIPPSANKIVQFFLSNLDAFDSVFFPTCSG